MDEQALPVPSAKHRQWSRGGAEDGHAFDFGRRITDPPRDRSSFVSILGRDYDRGEPPERRHRGFPPSLGLRCIEAGRIA